ncbi:MAG: hypothetical protein NT007_11935 [Candidatus Kapabacteria bacterium]|nr:hypothetical protein [Candidatus Kapabacteria bacterium]
MKEINRDYSMSNAELSILAAKIIANMTRDSTQFATRGVDSGDITALSVLKTAFDAVPPDEVYIGEIKDEASEKKALRDTLTTEIQTVSGFFEQKYGTNSGKYSSLRIKGFHNFSDGNFILTARNVAAQASAYFADLSAIGLTTTLLVDLTSNTGDIEDKIIDINTKKQLRDSKTVERTQKGNELFSYITQYCKIGKLIWENVDEAKYNDYIIYRTTPDLPSKVQGLTYDNATFTASWNPAASANAYELEYKSLNPSGPVPDWTNAYSGAELLIMHNPGIGDWLYRCRGTNDNGSGEWSNELPVSLGLE